MDLQSPLFACARISLIDLIVSVAASIPEGLKTREGEEVNARQLCRIAAGAQVLTSEQHAK